MQNQDTNINSEKIILIKEKKKNSLFLFYHTQYQRDKPISYKIKDIKNSEDVAQALL